MLASLQQQTRTDLIMECWFKVGSVGTFCLCWNATAKPQSVQQKQEDVMLEPWLPSGTHTWFNKKKQGPEASQVNDTMPYPCSHTCKGDVWSICDIYWSTSSK
jgi:hypothetical protein